MNADKLLRDLHQQSDGSLIGISKFTYPDGRIKYLGCYNNYRVDDRSEDKTSQLTLEQFQMYIRNGVLNPEPVVVDETTNPTQQYFEAFK